MCGLFGLIFNTPPKPSQTSTIIDLFSNLGLLSAKRGLDATGMAAVNKNGFAHTFKVTRPASLVVDSNMWYNRIFDYLNPNTRVLMGHTRKGTHGANTLANTHPFSMSGKQGVLTGMHNGVIFNYRNLTDLNLENDSAALFSYLNDIEDVDLPAALELVWGSFALTFQRGRSFHMTRNDFSSLCLAEIPGMNITMYASERLILQQAANLTKVKADNWAELPTYKLLTIDLPSMKRVLTNYSDESQYAHYYSV